MATLTRNKVWNQKVFRSVDNGNTIKLKTNIQYSKRKDSLATNNRMLMKKLSKSFKITSPRKIPNIFYNRYMCDNNSLMTFPKSFKSKILYKGYRLDFNMTVKAGLKLKDDEKSQNVNCMKNTIDIIKVTHA